LSDGDIDKYFSKIDFYTASDDIKKECDYHSRYWRVVQIDKGEDDYQAYQHCETFCDDKFLYLSCSDY